MGTGASISLCQSLSSVKVKQGGNKIGPEPQRIFGSPLDIVATDTTHRPVPLVVQHTVEYLEEFGLNHKGLFRINGSAAKIRALRLKYDQGEEVDLVKEGDINSVASILKLFLNQLPTAVFPEELCTDIWAIFEVNKNCATEQTRCLKRLLSRLPEAHSRLACFLVRFLAKVAENSDVNQMTLENLAIVFGPTLFRIPCSPLAYKKQTLCNAMLLHMLQRHEDLFLESASKYFSPMEEQSQATQVLLKLGMDYFRLEEGTLHGLESVTEDHQLNLLLKTPASPLHCKAIKPAEDASSSHLAKKSSGFLRRLSLQLSSRILSAHKSTAATSKHLASGIPPQL